MSLDDVEIRSLVAAEPTDAGDRPALAGWLQRMCRTAARHVPAAGVGVSLLDSEGGLMSAAASNATSAMVEELQYTLGEGPCLAAFATRSPVLVPDLVATASTTWPIYAPAAHEHGVEAVFAFPLQVGRARVGALDVYRAERGDLSTGAHGRVLVFCSLALEALLGVGARDDAAGEWLDDLDDGGYRVYQAQGMVGVQLGVSTREAMAVIRAYAFSHDRRLSEVAEHVVSRKLTFAPEDPDGGVG